MVKAIGYLMTNDTGFAPNPFHGHLTLATCKPSVRRARKVGEWVAGFASKELVKRSLENGLHIPFTGMVYLMRVGEVITLDEYFRDSRFVSKRPTSNLGNRAERCGDNIYYRGKNGEYRQVRSDFHGQKAVEHDTGGRNALIASEFYYLGRNCLVPEGGWAKLLGYELSAARTFTCPPDFVGKMVDYLAGMRIKAGINGEPCAWPSNTFVSTAHGLGKGSKARDQLPNADCS